MDYINVKDGIKWGKTVADGKAVACEYIKLACQRHFNDLDKSKNKDYPFKFDPAKAERSIKFIQLLPHVKGKWAREKKKLVLEPWQKFIIAMIFGWVEKKTGLRRFRECYEEIARKNAKSTQAAGIAINMFCIDGEFGAEVYTGATSEKQAWEVFRPAKLMIQRTPSLMKAAGIAVNVSNMNIPRDGSRFEPLIGKPGDGSSPHCAVVDEFHEHDTSELYDTMDTGMGARDQPLMLVITTAGDNIEGPCYDMRDRVIEMLTGTVEDERLLGFIFTIDKDDDWRDPNILIKANPNIGVSVDYEYLINQQKKAINRISFQNRFKTKHLNVWVQSMDSYFNMEDWNNCYDASLNIDDFKGQQFLACLDLASKIDICAYIKLFWKVIDGKIHYYCVSPTFYLPSETIEFNESKRQSELYQKWVNQGFITEYDGAEVDFNIIVKDVLEDADNYALTEIPHDEWGAFQIAAEFANQGYTPVKIPKTTKIFSPAMKEVEAAIKSGRFHHDGNPIMRWMMGNVVAKVDANENVFPRKEKAYKKIDGAVALFMGVNRAMMLTPPSSEYGFISNPIMVGI